MTIDWSMLATPLALLPIVALLACLGCGLDDEGGAPSTVQQLVIVQWASLEPNLDSIVLHAVVTDSSGEHSFPSEVVTATSSWLTQPGSYSLNVKVKNNHEETYTCTAKCVVVGSDGHQDSPGEAKRSFKLNGPVTFQLTYLVDVDANTQLVTGHHYTLG